MRRRRRLRRFHEKLECKKGTPITAVCAAAAVKVPLPFRSALRKSKTCFPTTTSAAGGVEQYCVFRVTKDDFFFSLSTCSCKIFLFYHFVIEFVGLKTSEENNIRLDVLNYPGGSATSRSPFFPPLINLGHLVEVILI